MSFNPFAALLVPQDDKEPENEIEGSVDIQNIINSEKLDLCKAIENIFLFTINKHWHSQDDDHRVFLEEMVQVAEEAFINLELLGQALFERLVLENPEMCIVPENSKPSSNICTKRVISYLFQCYIRLKNYKLEENTSSVMKNVIVQNATLILQQPTVFPKQNVVNQFLDIIKDIETPCEDFFIEISINYDDTEDEPTFLQAMEPILKKTHMDASRASLVNIDSYIYRVLEIFTSNEQYAAVLLNHITPHNMNLATKFADNLLGELLSLSILPKNHNNRYDYFDKALDQTSSIVEGNLWRSTAALNENMHRIFMRLLLCSKGVRSQALLWISKCLTFNLNRGKLWNAQSLNPLAMNQVSDGFMINLSNLVLRLCQPFCSKISDGKILKVDPTYCAVPNEECPGKDIHMYNLSKETCLIPTSTDEENGSTLRPTAKSYNFVTECFFLAHRALDLGFRVCVDRLIQLNQELSQLQRSYNDAIQQASGVSDVIDTIKHRLEDGLVRYRSLRAVLLEPNFLTLLCQFHMATAVWLTQVCLNNDFPEDSTSFAPVSFRKVVFPFSDVIPATLKCIPEFVVENTVGYLSFLRRFYPQTLEEQGYEFLNPILTMVLTFMGSPQRMRNPHLRARMAECLEALLPYHKDIPQEMNRLGQFQRESLFKKHPHRKQIVLNLLDVFVSIEMTGQSVQFEQKFNYRRPMYVVMDYLWQSEEHWEYFKELANEAEANMEAVTPPLFLRFVNLLMNDAVFLLDESLSNMAQLKTMQTARENGEWNNLPIEERTHNLEYMQHIGMIARFDNILGRETIHSLEQLTSKITTVFTHSTMVDRVAAMLNYFLYNLVGPNKKNFKVKDQKEYEFDPANTVLNICKIYVHLYECDSFCLAISQDGRSYSPQLFTLAEDVLARIGGGGLTGELQQVAVKVSKLATQQQADEEILAEAPDEFLDSIMSTLMTDPVILPSSKQVLDRTTIARHLLSDQTDPFNRSPLTMDQIISDTELANKIKAWIEERKKSSSKANEQ